MDVFERRVGWTNSLQIILEVKNKKSKGFISSLTVPIIYFLRARFVEEKQTRRDIKELIEGFEIISLSQNILLESFESEIEDFEDAIQFNSATSAGCKIIITRNIDDFEIVKDKIDILTPEEFLRKYKGDS
jgi:predicted nucleic acid-binding protein